VNSEHIQAGVMKNYLLGMLPEEEASAIEDRYFAEPEFFDRIRAMEMDLICEFLDGRLTADEREHFNRRCLQAPSFQKLVDEVRVRREAEVIVPQPRSMVWIPVAAAVLLCISGVSISVISFVARRKPVVQPVQQAAVEAHPQDVTLILEPGVTKGANSKMQTRVLPPQAQSVSLVASLPGQAVSAEYVVTIKSVGADGKQNEVFTSRAIQSVPHERDQRVTVTLPSAKLPPGDYLMQLSVEREVKETYIFGVRSADQ